MKRICATVILIFMALCCVSPFYNFIDNNKDKSIAVPTVEEKVEIYKNMMADGIITEDKIKDRDVLNAFETERAEKEKAHEYYLKYLERKAQEEEEARIMAQRNSDITYIAKTVWGEARGLSYAERAQVAWCILNRVDSGRFPNTVGGVVTQKNQFVGYSSSFPTSEWAVAEDVYNRWLAEKNGEAITRELAHGVCFFYGKGGHNHFYS